MKKTLLILSMFLMSAGLFAQSTILTTWEFGPTSFSPSITFNGAPSEQEIVSHIKVQNVGTADVTIKVVRLELNVMHPMNQFCWAGVCFSPDTDTSATSMTLAPGVSTDEFSGHLQPNGIPGLSAIQYTFYEVGNPTNASSVIVMYNTMFSVSSTDGDFISEHNSHLWDANINIPLHGVIKVHNYLPAPLNLVAFKQNVVIAENTTNWMFFGGNEYAFGTDTTDVTAIPATTTDESFVAHYDSDGNYGPTSIVYVFRDPAPGMEGSYALFFFKYSSGLGINDEILANTTFSSAYPNPAESFVSFNYDIPNEVSTAQIIMTNLLGAVVYEGTLSGNNGTARIDVSSFTEGIYFATLKLENQIVTTQKVLVQ